MGKTILLVLLSGFLMLGLSSAFAEEPTLSDLEVLKAWGQVQADVQEITVEAILEKKGLKPLTDENLDEINAAGAFNFGCGAGSVLCFGETINIGRSQTTTCAGVIANCSAKGRL